MDNYFSSHYGKEIDLATERVLRSVGVDGMDGLLSGRTSWAAVEPQLGAWTVASSTGAAAGTPTGMLLMFSDRDRVMVIQFYVGTGAVLSGSGGLTDSYEPGVVRVYHRSYSLRSPVPAPGTFSAWAELSGSGSGSPSTVTSADLEELRKLIRGTATDSSAFSDPQVQLGDFAGIDDLNNALNALASARYCGRLRVSLNGQNVDVLQFATSHSAGRYSQLALGNVVAANVEGTSSRLALSQVPGARILRRVSEGGVWGAWEEYGGGAGTGASGIYGIKASRGASGVTVYLCGKDGTALAGADGTPLSVTIPSADSVAAGFLSKADKAKLDGLPAGGGGGAEVFSVGKDGLVPGPPAKAETYLRSDGTWAVPASASQALATESKAGLCPKLPEQSSVKSFLSVLTGRGAWAHAPWALPFAVVRAVGVLNLPDATKTDYKVVYNVTDKCFSKAVPLDGGGYTYYGFTDGELEAAPYHINIDTKGHGMLPDSQLYLCTGSEDLSLYPSVVKPALYAAIGGKLYKIAEAEAV